MLNVIDDLMVIDSLGGIGSVFHVGKSLKMDVDEAVANMKEFIEKAIVDSGKLGCKSSFILETGAGCGTGNGCGSWYWGSSTAAETRRSATRWPRGTA